MNPSTSPFLGKFKLIFEFRSPSAKLGLLDNTHAILFYFSNFSLRKVLLVLSWRLPARVVELGAARAAQSCILFMATLPESNNYWGKQQQSVVLLHLLFQHHSYSRAMSCSYHGLCFMICQQFGISEKMWKNHLEKYYLNLGFKNSEKLSCNV